MNDLGTRQQHQRIDAPGGELAALRKVSEPVKL